MDKDDFDDLMQSLNEFKAILKGEMSAGRCWLVTEQDGAVTRTRQDLPVAPPSVPPEL